MSAVEVTVSVDPAVADEVSTAVRVALATAVRAALAGDEGRTTGDRALTLLLTDDERLQSLNAAYRGFDRPTDVLSFPDGTVLPDDDVLYLGDIAVSVETARRQAAAGGHALLAELQLLTVHGVLHLLGYDHTDADEQARMWTVQTAVLRDLGAAVITPPAPDH